MTLASIGAAAAAMLASVALYSPAGAANLKVLHEFSGSDGCAPRGGLTIDPDTGTLYGAATYCGSAGGGTVFSLTPPPPGKQRWQFRVIHDFDEPTVGGAQPETGLTFLKLGGNLELWGTTHKGKNQGTLFALISAEGGDWMHSVVHDFSCEEGAVPTSAPQFSPTDPRKQWAYGTTSSGSCGSGIVYRVNATSNEIEVIYNPDKNIGTFVGYYPQGVVIDGNGTLFGTAANGGDNSAGTVFRMDKFGKGKILHSFNGTNGRYPLAAPILDGNGGLLGTTGSGGKPKDCPESPGCGVVWQKPPLSKLKVKHSFRFFTQNRDGMTPNSPLVLDEQTGDIYGTTFYGGTGSSCGGVGGSCGTVFKISGDGDYTVLWEFPKGGPASPQGQLVFHDGALYGTSHDGGKRCGSEGYLGCGTIWKLTP